MLWLLEACFRKAALCCLQGLHSLLMRLSFNNYGQLLLGCMSAECRNPLDSVVLLLLLAHWVTKHHV
jgi:hypothetical protein